MNRLLFVTDWRETILGKPTLFFLALACVTMLNGSSSKDSWATVSRVGHEPRSYPEDELRVQAAIDLATLYRVEIQICEPRG